MCAARDAVAKGHERKLISFEFMTCVSIHLLPLSSFILSSRPWFDELLGTLTSSVIGTSSATTQSPKSNTAAQVSPPRLADLVIFGISQQSDRTCLVRCGQKLLRGRIFENQT
jgi:hypothetical protein